MSAIIIDPTNVNRFQENMKLIFQLVGWSDQDLADALDLTRPTVTKLKNGKCKLTVVQYLACKKLIDDHLTMYQTVHKDEINAIVWIMSHVVMFQSEDDKKRLDELREIVNDAVKKSSKKLGSDHIHYNVIKAIQPWLKTYIYRREALKNGTEKGRNQTLLW